MVHHLPACPGHPQTDVHVLEILAVSLVEAAHLLDRLAADHQKAAGEPIARPGLVGRVLGVEMALDRPPQQPAQAAPPRQHQRQRLKLPGGMGIGAVGAIQPAAGNAALRLAIHKIDHPPQALLVRVEVHVGIHQQHVSRGRHIEDVVEVGGVREPAGVAQHPRFGQAVPPRSHAVRGSVVDQDQPHSQPPARVRHRPQQPRHHLALACVDHADVEVGRH